VAALSESVGRWVAVEAYARMLNGDAQFRVVRYNARQCTHHTIITNRGPGSVMVGKDKPAFHASHHVTAITFLIIGIIATGILFVFTLVLNQNHTALAQQQPTGISFQIDNMTFSHHTASVNGIQLHYVIG
jgi:hypothetical protein